MHDKKPDQKDGSAKMNPAEEDEIIEGEIIEEGADADATSADAASAGTTPEGVSEGEVISEQDYNALAEELQQAQDKAKEYFDGWQRERADFANYKRRVERDQQTLSQNIKGEVVKKYLSVLDDLERAMKNRPGDGALEFLGQRH